MPERRRSDGGHHARRSRGPSEGEINIGLGFGELFKGFGDFLDLLGKMAEEGKSEVSRTQEVHGPGGVRGVYGFSVKIGVGGTPTIEHFGNIRTTEHGPEVSKVREPLVDVFDEEEHVLVVVELPGVAEDHIGVEVKDDILSMSAEGRDRTRFAKEILLPAMVDPSSLQKSYQAGILEIRLSKVKPPRP